MNPKYLASIGVAAFLLSPQHVAAASRHKFVNFDVPNAKGTFPFSINGSNAVTGDYTAASSSHGFIRTADGTITTFDVPQSSSTYPLAINTSGEVTGFFYDSSSIAHGFFRTSDGTITTIDVPGSSSTSASALNDNGDIVGGFRDSNGVGHAFLRKSSGEFVSFDPSGSLGTAATGINNDGLIMGYYCFTACASESTGFVRSADGTITPFSVKGAARIVPSAVNSKGEIAGRYMDDWGASYGFVRTAKGKIVTFAECSFVPGLNDTGWAVGASSTVNGGFHGCLRAPNGTISSFDDPKASGNETSPNSINTARYVTGWYADAHDHYHGFIVQPRK